MVAVVMRQELAKRYPVLHAPLGKDHDNLGTAKWAAIVEAP